MNNEPIKNFGEIAKKAEALYKSFVPVRCPYLESEVQFNTQGLEHIKFKRHDHARPQGDQYMRFKLLDLVPEVLRLSRTVQGIWETKHFERVRVHGRTDTILKVVAYYEFIAVLNKVRLKVVVKQVENGPKYFWSVIPFWRLNKDTNIRKLYGGNPNED